MEGFKEFHGKNLDAAIKDACSYFNASRERLEIEILQDARNGIFGIVGARKAIIRARRAPLRDAVESVLGEHFGQREARQEKKASPSPKKEAAAASGMERVTDSDTSSESATPRRHKPQTNEAAVEAGPLEENSAHALSGVGQNLSSVEGGSAEDEADTESSQQYLPFEAVDPEVAERETLEVIRHLIRPILGDEAELSASVGVSRIQVSVNGVEDCGLLIGREGMTLAAIQYFASRIVSRKLQASIRVQLDVGDYRERQGEKLREVALALAEKVRQTGRPLSTRPLCSYHRRIVHLCLKEVEGIQTRSQGEGAKKRVVIMRKKTV